MRNLCFRLLSTGYEQGGDVGMVVHTIMMTLTVCHSYDSQICCLPRFVKWPNIWLLGFHYCHLQHT